MRVLSVPRLCERFSGSDQPWLPCAMCVARGPVSVCRCRTRTAARRAVGTRTSSPCGRSSPPATVAGSTRAPRASAPARSCAPEKGPPFPPPRTLGADPRRAAVPARRLNPGGRRPPGFFACPPGDHRAPAVRRIRADPAVHGLPQQVGTAGVPAVLLAQVAGEPAQAGRPALLVGDVDELVEHAVGQGPVEPGAGPRDGVVPDRVAALRGVVRRRGERPVVPARPLRLPAMSPPVIGAP